MKVQKVFSAILDFVLNLYLEWRQNMKPYLISCCLLVVGTVLIVGQHSLSSAENVVSLESKIKEINFKEAESRKLYDVFVKKNSIELWPSLDKLVANPYIYKDKVIGIVAHFTEMLSETDGLFDQKGTTFIVSGIPMNKFTESTNVLLAAIVIGKKGIATPFGRSAGVPHLKFVDAYICKDQNCVDMLFWMEAKQLRDQMGSQISYENQRNKQEIENKIKSYLSGGLSSLWTTLHKLLLQHNFKTYTPTTVLATALIILKPDGNFTMQGIENSSGIAVYDESLMEAIQKVVKFKAMPLEMRNQDYKVKITASLRSDSYNIRYDYEPLSTRKDVK